jgi:SAM-dependent methyltransferase
MLPENEHLRIVGAKSLISEVFARIRRYGVCATVKKSLEYLTYKKDPFDRTHGTDTGRIEPLWRLHVTSPNKRFAVRYQTTDGSDFLEALRSLCLDPAKFLFIDLGCGKGRPLLIAAKCGFRRVIGVEFAHDLAEIAQSNIRVTNSKNITVIEGDVAEFQFPDNPIVLYMFNPFTVEIMERVLENLRSSSLTKLYVIYTNPTCFKLLDQSGFLTRIMTLPSQWGHIMIWRLTAG